MPYVNLDRELAEKKFEYGNHEIRIGIRVKYDNVWSHDPALNYSVTLHDSPESHYVREVTARAIKDETTEVKRETVVVLDAEEEVSHLFGGTKVKNKVVNFRDHISETVRPIFEELDKVYRFTQSEESVDVDAATHEIEAETSWVEVEDEIERLSREIEALAETGSE